MHLLTISGHWHCHDWFSLEWVDVANLRRGLFVQCSCRNPKLPSILYSQFLRMIRVLWYSLASWNLRCLVELMDFLFSGSPVGRFRGSASCTYSVICMDAQIISAWIGFMLQLRWWCGGNSLLFVFEPFEIKQGRISAEISYFIVFGGCSSFQMFF